MSYPLSNVVPRLFDGEFSDHILHAALSPPGYPHAESLTADRKNRDPEYSRPLVVAGEHLTEPVVVAAHLNLEKKTMEEKYSSKEEQPETEKKEEAVDEKFLDAIISDTDSYRIYIEQDNAKKDGEDQ